MKKVLITGLNSFIGNSFEKYVSDNGLEIEIQKTSLRNQKWLTDSWSDFDSILHVSGISQVDHNEISQEAEDRYFKVNGELTKLVGQKAQRDKIPHMIYLSSIMVYGNPGIGIIDRDTVPIPKSIYGRSKLEGEKVFLLNNENFKVTIFRTPMVYGNTEQGEISKWWKISKICAVFPKIDNVRGMIYIENLCELIYQCICNPKSGLCYPQNERSLSTSEMIVSMRKVQGKKTLIIPFFQKIVKCFCRWSESMNTVLGSMAYSEDFVDNMYCYHTVSFEESMHNTFGLCEDKKSERKIGSYLDKLVRKNCIISFGMKVLRKTGISPYIRKKILYKQYEKDQKEPSQQMVESIAYFEKHQSEIEGIISLLADTTSKIVYKNAIKFRCTHNIDEAPDYSLKDRYFPRDIKGIKTSVALIKDMKKLQEIGEDEYIALDLDGFEMKALIEIETKIRENRPQLAVCIYHRNEDFIQIAKWINNLDCGYRLFIRNHSFDLLGLVLYAI